MKITVETENCKTPVVSFLLPVRRQIILEENEIGVHLMSAINSEYAICGEAYDGYSDPDSRKQEAGVMQNTEKEKVTCKNCLKQIRNVKDYLSTSMDPLRDYRHDIG